MRAQRIYLCDSRHRGNKRRTYRSSGTYQIAVLVGFPHQLLCDNVHNGITVGDDGVQFPLQTRRYDFRKIGSVDRMCLVITDITEHLV